MHANQTVVVESGFTPGKPHTSLDCATEAAATPWTLYSSGRRWQFLSVIFLVTISGNFDYYVLGMVLDPIKREFHVSDSTLGLLSGLCFAICYAMAALPFARWSDLGNRRTALAVALTGWSVMTTLCGVAHAFWQLVVARLGVGAMEPGAIPPAQSLIVDYFPPEKRGTAMAVQVTGSSAGQLLGLALGGYIAATQGWRSTFIYAGVVGIALAVMARLVLDEPRCQLGFPARRHDTETLSEALAHLRRKRTFIYLTLGMSGYMFFAIGMTTFLPSHVIRAMHASLAQTSVTWGISAPVANFAGTLIGGWLTDRLARSDVRWYGWLPALFCGAAIPVYWMAFATDQLWNFIPIDFVAELLLGIGTMAVWPAVQVICGHRRRAMAVAVFIFVYVLVGCGLGPYAVGAMSDAFGAAYGPLSLRYSLYVLTLVLLPTAALFLRSTHSIKCDLEH